MGLASVAFGLVGVGCIAMLLAVDAAGVPHGSNADAALVVGWLTGGTLALGLGLAARATAAGRAGVVLSIVALPVGLIGLLALIAVLT